MSVALGHPDASVSERGPAAPSSSADTQPRSTQKPQRNLTVGSSAMTLSSLVVKKDAFWFSGEIPVLFAPCVPWLQLLSSGDTKADSRSPLMTAQP